VEAEPASTVYLNGVPSPVFFNDGDSFKVLSGKFTGTRARLSGFNTLESYGKVHSWGDWTEKELKVLAKMGTMNARKGTWRCISDLSKDTYGRTLWWCPDLAEDQIRKGLAHVLNIWAYPGDSELIIAQREAIKARRGIWSHGVPEFVLTSLHSIDERPGDKPAYNRLVSSVDGHSHKWPHREEYKECQKVCWKPSAEDRWTRLVQRLHMQPQTIEYMRDYDDNRLSALLKTFKSGESISVGKDGFLKESHRFDFELALKEMKNMGWFMAADADIQTCMVYTNYRRRFGNRRASCL